MGIWGVSGSLGCWARRASWEHVVVEVGKEDWCNPEVLRCHERGQSACRKQEVIFRGVMPWAQTGGRVRGRGWVAGLMERGNE